jgi:hypothetical protein
MQSDPVLVTGATGYVGGRLIPKLLEDGYRVRAMGRSRDKPGCRPWAHHPRVELTVGDVLNPESIKRAAQGCNAAFYLVHSMIARKERTGLLPAIWRQHPPMQVWSGLYIWAVSSKTTGTPSADTFNLGLKWLTSCNPVRFPRPTCGHP